MDRCKSRSYAKMSEKDTRVTMKELPAPLVATGRNLVTSWDTISAMG